MESSVVPSKEMKANQPANPEIDEAHNQPEEIDYVIPISDSFQQRFRKLMDSDASVKEEDKGHKPFIGQVPILLGMETKLKQYFHPRIMSIGPVHHGKNDLEQGQHYKINYLTKVFIEQSRQPKEILYDNILNEIESFKECYDQGELLKKFKGDDQELAWLFFVDGCALIQFFCCYVDFSFHDMNIIARDKIDLMATDLMLLDNQLPLGVLNLVMGFSKEGGELYQNDHPVGKQSKELRKSVCRFIEMIRFGRCRKREKADSVTDESFRKANHLLELIWMNFIKKEKDGRFYITEATSRYCRSVKDLQAAGIRLERNRSSSSLRDIYFHRESLYWKLKVPSLFWKLKVPSLLVDEQGKFLLFNLIAFEMHPNFGKDLVVTSYISFLNSLIETKEDVAELQKAGILLNYLPNDQEVVKTFHELTSSLMPYPYIFYDTKEKLICYFNDKESIRIGRWLSQVMHVYFRSPSTTVAVKSATFLLILTIIQTFFSVLAYISPPRNN